MQIVCVSWCQVCERPTRLSVSVLACSRIFKIALSNRHARVTCWFACSTSCVTSHLQLPSSSSSSIIMSRAICRSSLTCNVSRHTGRGECYLQTVETSRRDWRPALPSSLEGRRLTLIRIGRSVVAGVDGVRQMKLYTSHKPPLRCATRVEMVTLCPRKADRRFPQTSGTPCGGLTPVEYTPRWSHFLVAG